MSWFAAAILAGVTSFAATNIDDIVILMLQNFRKKQLSWSFKNTLQKLAKVGVNVATIQEKPSQFTGQNPKKAPSDYENALYFLGAGKITEHKWDCDGVYLPSDVKATDLSVGDRVAQALTGRVAVKIVDGTQFVATANPQTAAIEFNVPTAKFFQPGDLNWFVPDVTQAYIDTQVPNAPTEENDQFW